MPESKKPCSNLLKRIEEPARSELLCKFGDIIDKFDETDIESRVGVQHNEFVRLRLTNAVLLVPSQDPSLILLTIDFELYLAAMNRGLKGENFNYHRVANSS